MKMKKLVLVLVIVLGFGLLANTALAFRLSPASLEAEVKRGHEQTPVLNISNSEDHRIYCRIYAVGFEVKKNGKQLFEKATQAYSAVNWIAPAESRFWIPANSTKEVAIEITVPRNAKPGEYFATIMAETSVPAKTRNPKGAEISMAVNFRLGCITRITVPGRTVRKKAEVSEVRVEVPSPENENQDITVIATLGNKCRVHLDAKGTVLIKNTEDRIFDKFVLQGAGKNARGEAFVFPQGSRDFWGVIQKPLPPGEYVAEVSFGYGYRSRRLRAETTFIVSKELGKQQKESWVISAEPSFVEIEMFPGAFRVQIVMITNLGFEPLKLGVSSLAPSWLKVEPAEYKKIFPGRTYGLQLKVSVEPWELVERVGKVVLKPERGEPIIIDVVVSEYKREEERQ